METIDRNPGVIEADQEYLGILENIEDLAVYLSQRTSTFNAFAVPRLPGR